MKTYLLPVRLSDLLDDRKVESDRLEFKEGWNPATIFRTVCAFANDFHNYGGGYVIVGVGEEDGVPVLPPKGIAKGKVEAIQKELLQYGNLIQPPYFPILGMEEVKGKQVLVLWCPGGQTRPYKVPRDVTTKDKDYAYYIRHYSNSVIAKNGELRELMRLTATVPFDDRINHEANLDDLDKQLIRAYLKEVDSALYRSAGRMPFEELCRQMAIVSGSEEYEKPRNVGLLFFSDGPERFFPYTQIDVVHLPQGPAGDRIEEQIFKGPLDHQLRSALRHLQSEVVKERITKLPDRAEADRIFNYPYKALEEALVNAVYHRGYDVREPIEVRVQPNSIEILSYPGPDPSIRLQDLKGERIFSRRYRNRRIGEFLKELDLSEGRFTGIPKIRAAMRRNGSPPPTLVTDDERTFFAVELRIHPAFVQAEDGLNETERRLLQALSTGPLSVKEIARALGHEKVGGNLWKALDRLGSLRWIALTLPDKPRSGKQKRQLTAKGRKALTGITE